ncbi:hypothetical protein SSP24_34930 [Streptomyces spinoverrucosus]|uniref:Uncharacterized protein n=1 Tax=Streptomyces spinoverrucosus TaxID=284043 RepID=A0A4Y3VIA0_9ACTN|nr:hypothetical protein [Streptomyces spinoverrucosus]GEC05838.1 hypothetical protein SSP24_34930 [Streptomyces spinoverrucosus]GHB82364.1 hypothetical protein GCM10010397_61770 [Streptomyces spinoverrucosus]
MTLQFGIYPGGILGDDQGIVHPRRPDLPDRIIEALDALQGDRASLSVRAYHSFAATVTPLEPPTPADPQSYLHRGRKLDLVLQFREPSGELDGWLDFIREAVRAGGPHLASVQICEEPNADLPAVDGSIPNVLNALGKGVVAAKQEARALGLNLAVGFNAVPTFNPADTFWAELGALADDRFRQDLDYVGLDFFPDVFRPIAAEQLTEAVTAVLTAFRRTDLPKAGIPDSVAIRICENGWPTGPGRSEQRQAAVLEAVVRTVSALAADLNIDGYSFFALRDADSTAEGLFHHFGLLRDDYTPKPAFETYRRLINELGDPAMMSVR